MGPDERHIRITPADLNERCAARQRLTSAENQNVAKFSGAEFLTGQDEEVVRYLSSMTQRL